MENNTQLMVIKNALSVQKSLDRAERLFNQGCRIISLKNELELIDLDIQSINKLLDTKYTIFDIFSKSSLKTYREIHDVVLRG